MEGIMDHIPMINDTMLNRTFHNQPPYLPQPPRPLIFDYFFYCISAIGCFGIIGNILTAVILLKNTIKSIAILLLFLITSDTFFIILICTQSYYLTNGLDLAIWSEIPFQLQPLIGFSSGICAIIGFERSIATLLPFWYQRIWTRKKTVISIIPLFLVNYGVVIIKKKVILTDYDTYIRLSEQLVTRYVPGVCIFVTNILIAVAMLKYVRSRKVTLTISSKKEMKVTRIMFVIIVIFFICMLPVSIIHLLIDTNGYPASSLGTYIVISQILEVINASCNFVIYVTTSKFHKKQYMKLLFCKVPEERESTQATQSS